MNYISTRGGATSAAFFLALLLGASIATAQEKAQPRRDLQGARETILADHCREAKARAPMKTDLGALMQKESEEMYCNCIPAETIRLEPGMTDPNSKTEMMKVLDQATDACFARQIRRTTSALCPTNKDALKRATDINAHCACIDGKIAKLSDDQFKNEIEQAFKNTRDTDAKRGGYEDLAIARYGAQCQAEKRETR